jgi:hypothetical protein
MRSALGLGVVLLLGALTMQACGDDEAAETSPGPPQQTSLGDCADLLPDSVFAALGWDPAGDATLDGDTCTRAATQGDAEVQRRAVAAVGGDDLPAAAASTFEEHCADLYGESGTAVDWLGADTSACALLAPDRGMSVLVVVTDDDAVVEVRVDADESTPEAQVQAGLVELAQAATATF